MSAELELQRTIITHLKSYAPLTSLLATASSIYDNVPQAVNAGDNSAFPYVVIGDDTSIDFDTDDTSGFEMTLTIHTWSRKRARTETKRIMGRIHDALQYSELTVTGYQWIVSHYEFSSTTKDPDGKTIHGIQRFRILLQEV